MAKMILDYINMVIAAEGKKGERITYDEWCDIRRTGTPEEIEDAVERMMLQGGYDSLVTESD